MADERLVYNVLKAIEDLASKRGDPYATRNEIAKRLDFEPDDISREGLPATGPLGRAIEEGLIEENPKYAGYWRLTPEGQTWLDSAMFNR
jgi:hypothetical protein